MDHIKKHVIPDYNSETDKEQCRYCLKAFPTMALLNEHMASIHPTQTAQSKGNVIKTTKILFKLEFYCANYSFSSSSSFVLFLPGQTCFII